MAVGPDNLSGFVPLYYTLAGEKFVDWKRLWRACLFALPAVAVFLAIRIFIPAWNDDPYDGPLAEKTDANLQKLLQEAPSAFQDGRFCRRFRYEDRLLLTPMLLAHRSAIPGCQ